MTETEEVEDRTDSIVEIVEGRALPQAQKNQSPTGVSWQRRQGTEKKGLSKSLTSPFDIKRLLPNEEKDHVTDTGIIQEVVGKTKQITKTKQKSKKWQGRQKQVSTPTEAYMYQKDKI